MAAISVKEFRPRFSKSWVHCTY